MTYPTPPATAIVGWNMPTFVPRRYHPGGGGTWSGHLAFAHDLIKIIRPKLIVELGTDWGESYFTFCQTVAEGSIDTLCYAIDTWRGDEHSGYYGEEIFANVVKHNEQYYRSFSYLLRTDFNESLNQFADQSIDLLHIDGLHTYEAGSRDFRNWIPKVTPGGIVLFHDICARHVNFGIWQLWDELKKQFSDTFEFRHSWGLGVLRNGTGPEHAELRTLFSGGLSTQNQIREIYNVYASHLDNLLLKNGPRTVTTDQTGDIVDGSTVALAEPAAEAAAVEPSRTTVQIYLSGPEGYSEHRSSSQVIEVGAEQHLSFFFPDGIGLGALRIDPSNCTAMVDFMSIALHSEDGLVIWKGTAADLCGSLSCSGTAAMFPQPSRCLILSYGADPQVMLPNVRQKGALRLELLMRVDALDLQTSAVTALLLGAQALADAEYAALRAESMVSSSERRLLEAELSRIATERNQASSEVTGLRQSLKRMADELRRAEMARAKAESLLGVSTKAYEEEHATLESVLRSKSWHLTEPLRQIVLKMRLK